MQFEFDVRTPLDRPVVEVVLQIPIREFYNVMNSQIQSHDFINRVLDDLTHHVAHYISNQLANGGIDQMIAEAIKKEVKDRVSAVVEERVADFFGEED